MNAITKNKKKKKHQVVKAKVKKVVKKERKKKRVKKVNPIIVLIKYLAIIEEQSTMP